MVVGQKARAAVDRRNRTLKFESGTAHRLAGRDDETHSVRGWRRASSLRAGCTTKKLFCWPMRVSLSCPPAMRILRTRHPFARGGPGVLIIPPEEKALVRSPAYPDSR